MSDADKFAVADVEHDLCDEIPCDECSREEILDRALMMNAQDNDMVDLCTMESRLLRLRSTDEVGRALVHVTNEVNKRAFATPLR